MVSIGVDVGVDNLCFRCKVWIEGAYSVPVGTEISRAARLKECGISVGKNFGESARILNSKFEAFI